MRSIVVCATYGRIPYLRRVLASFLSQTHDDKHLVIVNDDKNVTLCCGYDNVTVINCSDRLSIGAKYNLGISCVGGDVIFIHNDTDVFLPKMIESHVDHYTHPICGVINKTMHTIENGVFTTSNVGICNSSFAKTGWYCAHGYNHT